MYTYTSVHDHYDLLLCICFHTLIKAKSARGFDVGIWLIKNNKSSPDKHTSRRVAQLILKRETFPHISQRAGVWPIDRS